MLDMGCERNGSRRLRAHFRWYTAKPEKNRPGGPALGPKSVTRVCAISVTLLVLSHALTAVAGADNNSSADAAAHLDALYSGPGVVLRSPENCVGDSADPWSDQAIVDFCAVKDVVGALGGPSSGDSPADFIEAPNRFEFSQPIDCGEVGAEADGEHDGCAVITGAATLLRAGLPVRLYGVCAKPTPEECAVLGTITDLTWKPNDVYLLMDPARVDVHCQYAQDALRNGCSENGAHTAGEKRPPCSAEPTDLRCEFGPDEQAQMLAAYVDYCSADPTNCLTNHLEAQWGVGSIVAVGYVNRSDQPNDCAAARKRAAAFTQAVNARWSTDLPIVQLNIDVADNRMAFADAIANC